MNGWDAFEGQLGAARQRLEAGWAPVALVCVKAAPDGADGAVLTLDGPGSDHAVLWQPEFPPAERRRLLEDLAARYRAGVVLRSDGQGRPL